MTCSPRARTAHAGVRWGAVNVPTPHPLEALIARGVEIVDPRQTFVAPEVRAERVGEGTVLHPGTRLHGARTFLGPGCEIGREGPAVLRDAVLGARARVDAGYLERAVLLDEARAGAGSHFRPGTLLEEQASTAHAVGLKHTILLAFVTLGSLINFCDCLMAGGRSRSDHSEVGSGFIHFNYTPWGEQGDKATPSLIGDVVHGVFLRERRIFLGGSGGLVGPSRIGFGAITGAGQVVRSDVPAETLVLGPAPSVRVKRDLGKIDGAEPRARRNLEYIAELVALRAWYREVRLARARSEGTRTLVACALETLDECIEERRTRLAAFLRERGRVLPTLHLDATRPCPIAFDPALADLDHVAWVRSLSEEQVEHGVAWLSAIARDVLADV